jgi:MFS family permease
MTIRNPRSLARALQSIRAYLPWGSGSRLSLEDRNILWFSIDTALQGLMMGGIFTFISVFVVRLGASNLQVSLLTSLPSIVLMLFSLPAGQFVQRKRDLVRVTNWTRLFHRGSFLLVALLPFSVESSLVTIIIVVWAAKSVSSAVLEAAWMGVVVDVIPPARRPKVNGMRWAVLGIVTAGAVALFGLVLDRVAFPLNYQIVFLISFVGGVLGIWFYARIRIPENQAPASSAARSPLGRQIREYWETVLHSPGFLRFQLPTSVLRLGLNLCTALYSIYWIRHLDASDLWISYQATAGKLAMIGGYFLWGVVVSRVGHHVPLLIATVGMGLYPVLMALVPGQTWLPAVAVVQGLFITGIDLCVFDTMLGVCGTENRARLIAVNTLLWSAFMFLAPMLGSLLADWIDVRGVFWIAGGVHLVAALLFWRLGTGRE